MMMSKWSKYENRWDFFSSILTTYVCENVTRDSHKDFPKHQVQKDLKNVHIKHELGIIDFLLPIFISLQLYDEKKNLIWDFPQQF